MIRQGVPSVLMSLSKDDLTQVDGEMVVEAARAGDQLANLIFGRAAFYLGIGVTNLLHLYNPEIVIIGGGVSNAGDLLFGPVRDIVAHRAMPSAREGVSIVPAALGDDAGLLGAVALVLSGDPTGFRPVG
jgi:glucokinase